MIYASYLALALSVVFLLNSLYIRYNAGLLLDEAMKIVKENQNDISQNDD